MICVTNFIGVDLAVVLACSFLCLLLIVSIAVTEEVQGMMRRIFIWGLFLNIVIMLGDASGMIASGHPGRLAFVMSRGGYFVSYLGSYLLIIVFSHYVQSYLQQSSDTRIWKLIQVICSIGILLTWANLFTGFFYTFNEQNQYLRQEGYWLSQGLGVLGIACNYLPLLRDRRQLSQGDRWSLALFITVPALAMAFQISFYGVVTVHVASTITVIFVFLWMQSKQAKLVRQQRLALENTLRQREKLNEANRLLDEVGHAQERLLSTVSHELNNPLSVISANAQLVNALTQRSIPNKELTQEVSSSLELIVAEAERMSRLTKQMMDTELRREKQEAFVLLDFKELLLATAKAYQPLVPESIQLSIKSEENLPAIFGSRDRLIQVLLNLFANSLEHTQQGQIQVVAFFNGKQIVTRVKDTGSGIPPELLPRVFERKVKDPVKGNHGIGLTVCREIIQQHQGSIRITSQLGEGTEVTFLLPAQTMGFAGLS